METRITKEGDAAQSKKRRGWKDSTHSLLAIVYHKSLPKINRKRGESEYLTPLLSPVKSWDTFFSL